MHITLATLAEATPQQVFDQVVGHLRMQGEKSMLPYTEMVTGNIKMRCAYRSINNGRALMCGAGCLIGDDEYRPGMEGGFGHDWDGLVDKGVFPKTGTKTLIQQLQQTHDNHPVDLWEEDLSCVAKQFSLHYTPPSPVSE